MKKIWVGIIFLAVLSLVSLLAPRVGAEPKKAPDFKLRDPWNFEFSLSQFYGSPVILHFFRIYCGGRITRESFNQIEALKEVCAKLCNGEKCTKGDFHIISVTLASCPTTDLKEWAKYFKINWLLGNDYDDYRLDIIRDYSEFLSKLRDPALIFVNRNQEIVFTSNALNSSEIMDRIKELDSSSKD